jgi:hypothetical protein
VIISLLFAEASEPFSVALAILWALLIGATAAVLTWRLVLAMDDADLDQDLLQFAEGLRADPEALAWFRDMISREVV